VILPGDQTQDASRRTRPSIAPRLALHQNELDVILDDAVGLKRFAQEAPASPIGLVSRIGDLVPDDRREIVKPQSATMLLDGRVQRHDHVPTVVLAARKTNVSHDTDHSAARHKSIKTTAPHCIPLVQEDVVVLHVAELHLVVVVVLQAPIRRRGHDEMNAAGL